MKFIARVKGLMSGLDPVMTVASKSTVKDYKNAKFVTIHASEEGVTASADGGRISMSNTLDALNQSELAYNCIEKGSITVRASDIKRILQSFDENDEMIFEVKTANAYSSNNVEEKSQSEDNISSTDEEEQLTPDQYAMLDSGKEVVCSLVSDNDEFQTMPCSTAIISIPEVDNNKKGINIRRDVFVSSASRISFAHGFQEFRPEYLYWVMRVEKEHVRFAAGSGGRFAVLDTYGEGNSLTDASKKIDILIPNHITAAMIDVFGNIDNDYINIYSGEKQIVLRCGSLVSVISQIDPGVKWPNENDILNRSHSVKITTKIGNWLNAIKGISATYSDDIKKQRQIHTASITLDTKSKMLHAKSNDQLKSHRKIPINDCIDNGSGENMTLRCVSRYLTEAIKNGEDEEYIQMEIENDTRPIVIRYYSSDKISKPEECRKVNESLGITEQYTIFFAPRTKDK